jgi:hypothetical protein
MADHFGARQVSAYPTALALTISRQNRGLKLNLWTRIAFLRFDSKISFNGIAQPKQTHSILEYARMADHFIVRLADTSLSQ